jgi:hypothetical protein
MNNVGRGWTEGVSEKMEMAQRIEGDDKQELRNKLPYRLRHDEAAVAFKAWRGRGKAPRKTSSTRVSVWASSC